MVDHHWIQYRKEDIFVPDLNKFGFVYLITNLQNGKGYIGCKQYLMYRHMKEIESNWKTYMGSSKWLTKDIEKIGKEHFKFEIIAEYKNRRSLRYYELYYQMKFNVLSSTFEGTDEPAYYNSRVGGKFYRPVESYQDPAYLKKLSEAMNTAECKKKISEAIKKIRRDPEVKKKYREIQKKRWKDPKYQKAMSERKYYKDPEYLKKKSIIMNEPERKKKMIKNLKKTLQNPEVRKKNLIQLSKARNRKRELQLKKQNVQTK